MSTRKIATKSNERFTVTVYRDAEWDEFRAVVAGRPWDTYHTNDKDDAIGTAELMLVRLLREDDYAQRTADADADELRTANLLDSLHIAH